MKAFVDGWKAPNPSKSGESRAPSPVGLPGASARASKPTLRYDGKTFNQWRDMWRTELNPDRRVEAIKAFLAFARAGEGKAAAEAILDVMRTYDCSDLSEENKVKQMAISCFHAIGDEVIDPLIRRSLEGENRNDRLFAMQVLMYKSNGDSPSDAEVRRIEKNLPELVNLIDDTKLDTETRAAAIGFAARDHRSDKRVQEALRKALGDEDNTVVLTAIEALVPKISNRSLGRISSNAYRKRDVEEEAYLNQIPDETVDAVIALAADEKRDEKVRGAAMAATIRLASHPKVVSLARELAKDLDSGKWPGDYRYAVFSAAGEAAADVTVPAMIEQYKRKGTSEKEKVFILHALGRIGPAAKDALPLVKEATKSENANLRKLAEQTLNKIAPPAPVAE